MSLMLGVWGSYMPFAAALALLVGPLWIGAFGWRAWWWVLSGLSLAMAAWALRTVPAPAAHGVPARSAAAPWAQRLRRTLSAPGPWLVAMTFAVYAGQWLAVIGFLPSLYLQAGLSGAATGVLTALAAAVNMLGNVASGRLQHAGVAPTRLLNTGFVVMGVAAVAAYAVVDGVGLPAWLRYGAVLLFSMVGGLIPATLFTLAVRLAPGEGTLSTTVGWMQQWSSFGQFAGPPLVAWLASRSGGWQWTWVATGACALLGLLLAGRIAQLLRRTARAPAGPLRDNA
jgi:CP family cyanate transporter-like MFS transporter